MYSDDIAIRPLATMAEFTTVSELEMAIWGLEPIENTSPHLMMAVAHAGGAVLGAIHAGELIGFAYGLPARRSDEWVLWSHITGVLPELQGQGIGFRLKQAQRKWAMRAGYRVIAWTFDPMRRGNANFNMCRLGAFATAYHVNRYGQMTDGLNTGMASDRLEAWWVLTDPRVVALAEGEYKEAPVSLSESDFLLWQDADGTFQQAAPSEFDAPVYGIEVPGDLDALKAADLAHVIEWQRKARVSMLLLLDMGYTVTDFVSDDDRCYYVLGKVDR